MVFIPLPTDTPESTGNFIPFPTQQSVSQFSEHQSNVFATSAALAEQNLNPATPHDTSTLFSNAKNGLDSGQEEDIRSNINELENQSSMQGAKDQFNTAVLNNDPVAAQNAVNFGKSTLNTNRKDAVEYNALDTFRQDTVNADGDKLDNTQALLASSALANQSDDKKATNGLLDVSPKYKSLQKSAMDDDNTVTNDMLDGVLFGTVSAFNGFLSQVSQGVDNIALQINKNLPESYYKLFADNADQLKNLTIQGSKENINAVKSFYGSNDKVLNEDLGTPGKVTAGLSKFIVGMAGASKLPGLGATEGAATGLNGLRAILSATIGDAAVSDGVNSAVKDFTDTFPSTHNTVTNYLGSRPEDSFWENKMKQTIEGFGLNSAMEGAVTALFKGAKSIYGATQAIQPIKEIAANPIDTSNVLGNKDFAATMAYQKLSADPDINPLVDQVVTVPQAIKSSTPSILQTPLDVKPEIGISGDVSVKSNVVAAQRQIQELSSSSYSTNRLSDGEMYSAVAATKERMIGLYAEKGIADISTASENGINVMSVHIGQKEGGAFKTEVEAQKVANDLNGEVVKTPEGTFYAVKKHAVQETGFVNPWEIDKQGTISSFFLNKVNVANPNNYLPNALLEDIAIPHNAKNVIKKEFVNPLLDTYARGVSKEQFETVNTIAAIGRDAEVERNGNITTGRWFNREEFDTQHTTLKGSNATDNTWNSYQAYREMNDLQYAIDNHNEYIRKTRMGYEEFNSTHSDFSYKGNAIIKDNADLASRYHVYSVDDAKVFKPGEITPEEIQVKYGNHKIIQLEGDTKLPDGSIAKYILMNKGDFNSRILDYQQVTYRPGGRVVYSGKYFTKQARIETLPDGTKVNRNPLTHYTSESRRELGEHATKLENARNAYKSATEDTQYKAVQTLKRDGTFSYNSIGRKLTTEEADQIIAETAMGHTDNMAKLVSEGTISKDTPFEVREDKELPLEYNKNSGAVSYIDENHSGQTSWQITNKRTKFRARGDRLLNPQEEIAQVLSPNQSIQKSMNSIVNSGLSGDYFTRVSEQFTATAKAHGFLKPEYETSSASKVWMAGEDALKPPINGAGDKDYMATVAIMKQMKVGMGYKSEASQLIDEQIKNFAEWYDKNDLKFLGSKGKVPEFDVNKPLNTINTLMYHTNFGLFNLKQFIIQGGSGYLATALQSPIRATQALFTSGILHSMMHVSEDVGSKLLDNKPLLKLLGFDSKEEYLELWNSMKKSGYVDVTGSHIDLARQKMYTGRKGVAFDLLDKAFEAGSIPVRSGEALNQQIGYHVAFMRFKDTYPELKTDAAASAGWIIREADKVIFDMKSATRRSLNTGVLQFPLKYKNFMVNVAESMTTGQKFSTKQKAIFWSGMVGMFGLPSFPTFDKSLEAMGLEDPKSREKVIGGLLNGLVDLSSNDTLRIDLSSDFSPTGALSDLYTQTATSDAKFWPIVGGALGAKVTLLGDKVGKAVHLLGSTNGQPLDAKFRLTEEALGELAKVTSSWNNYSRGKLALDTGRVDSNMGVPIVDGVDNMTAKMMMLGMQNRDVNQFYKITMATYQDKENDIKDKAAAVTYFRNKAMEQDINSPGGRASFDMFNKVTQYITANEPDFSAIQRKANSNFKQTLQSKSTFIGRKLQQLKDSENANENTNER